MKWLILIIMLSGCAVPVDESKDAETKDEPKPCIRISSDAEPDDVEAVMDAADKWFKAVPELECPIAVSDEPNVVFLPHVLVDEDESLLVGTYRDGVVLLFPDAVRSEGFELLPVTTHELGHLFADGGGHHDGPGIMVEHVDEQAEELTEEDVEWLARNL